MESFWVGVIVVLRGVDRFEGEFQTVLEIVEIDVAVGEERGLGNRDQTTLTTVFKNTLRFLFLF